MSVEPDLGLQRERTSLSWTRTALALVANGVLVLLRNEHSFPLPVAVTLSVLWGLLALATIAYATRRYRLVQVPDDQVRAAHTALVLLAAGIGTLCTATALLIALT